MQLPIFSRGQCRASTCTLLTTRVRHKGIKTASAIINVCNLHYLYEYFTIHLQQARQWYVPFSPASLKVAVRASREKQVTPVFPLSCSPVYDPPRVQTTQKFTALVWVNPSTGFIFLRLHYCCCFINGSCRT